MLVNVGWFCGSLWKFVEGPHNTPCKQGEPDYIFWGVCPLPKMAPKSLCYQLPKIAENYQKSIIKFF